MSILLTALLAGCAAPSKMTKAPVLTGALVVVRLENRLEFPPAVTIEVVSEVDGSLTAVAGRRQQSIPGQYADYLLAIALPPQRYSITAIKTIGKTAGESFELLSSTKIPFDVKPSNPVYLGRLVIAAKQVTNVVDIDVQDHVDEDVLLFRSVLAPLRTATIDKSIVASLAIASVKVNLRQEETSHLPVQLAVDTVNREAESLLPTKARPAFKRFLALNLPRALAVDNAGGSSLRSGNGAMQLAMRGCVKRANDKSCRIFAVDNTLVVQASCLLATEGQKSSIISAPACLVQRQKLP